MKKLIIYTLITSCFTAGCRKNDNTKLPDMVKVPLPIVIKEESGDLVISAQEPESFTGKFKVDLFYKDGTKPAFVDVVVMKNNDTLNVKPIQGNISTYPTEISITGEQLITLFGEPIVLGDNFDIGINVTTMDGKKYLAFPPPVNGVPIKPYSSNVASQEGATPTARYSAVCQFDAAEYAGNFEVIVDEWQDYSPGDIIPVTVINDHQLSFEYPTEDAKPIIVNVNTVTNETSVVRQGIGNYGPPPGWPYGEIFVESITSNDNYVAPCELTLSVRLKFTVAAGSFGDAMIKLRKVN